MQTSKHFIDGAGRGISLPTSHRTEELHTVPTVKLITVKVNSSDLDENKYAVNTWMVMWLELILEDEIQCLRGLQRQNMEGARLQNK